MPARAAPAPRGAEPAPARRLVAPHDAIWLQDSPTNLMIINAVYTTDRLDLNTVRDIFQRRVIDAAGGARYPRFRDRVVRAGGRWFWEQDPAFDVARHIVPAPHAALTGAEALQEWIGAIADQPLPPDRPLWQVQHIASFDDDGSAFVVRLHHAMGDGIALVPIIFALMDELRAGGQAVRPHGGYGSRLARLVVAPVLAPFVLARRLAWRADRHAWHGAPVSGRKRVAWTRPFPLEQLRAVKQEFGATLNDLLLTGVSGAFARLFAQRPPHRVQSIRVSMPVNMREPHEEPRMENRFAAVLLELPVGAGNVRERLRATKARLDALKHSVEPLVIYGVQNALLGLFPNGVSRRLIDFLANKCTGVVTNVPGPDVPLTLAGRRVRTLMYWVPQRADIGIGISILTFAGTLRIGVIADVALVSDPSLLTQALEEEFDALVALATG